MLKGNDYLLIWLLTEPDGTPIDYNQFESYKVFIQNDSNKSYKYEVETAALDDGLHFDFKADMQKSTGYYSLIFEAVKDGRNYKAECYRGVHIDGNVDKAQCVVGASNSTIKLTDCLSLYLGGRDGRSPYVGVNNHWWAFDDLQKAYADTGIQVDYSAEIGAQITLAEQAIARVNQTNQTVSENEIARSQNEAIREQEERTRMANEAKRVDDEKVRVANEAKRAEDEAERLSNEASRKGSEAARVNNEAARVSGEDVRVRNEASRTSEESTRVSNENARKSNEISRVNAESSRVSAEQSRVTEEEKRVTAETKRQADTAKAIQDTNTAAQNATNVAAGMEGQITQLQQNKLDKAEFTLQNQGVYGLGFKSGDNTVNLKTPEINLGLNDFTVELWARMEGSTSAVNCVLGISITEYDAYSLKIYNTQAGPIKNSVDYVLFQKPTNGALISNSIQMQKSDSTKNLHHIVITRQGTLVTATINGRLIKSVTQDRVLDFSKFVFDIANTTYFSLGRVFNYAMSADEVQMLWNGGRVDEVVLDRGMYDKKDYNYLIVETSWGADAGYSVSKNDKGKIIVTVNGNRNGISWPWTLRNYPYSRVYLKIKTLNNCVAKIKFENISFTTSGVSGEEFEFITPNNINGHIQITTDSHNPNEDGKYIAYEIVECFSLNCLLELLPQNIHSSGIYNTGSLGSSHDAVLSKPAETIFHKERPYKDKQMSTGAPNFHPIAMGQKVYSDTGLIYEAAIPPTSREWSTADWKQVNNN